MAKKKKTPAGTKQDRSKVAGGQDYEVRYESRKTGSPADQVKTAVKALGNSRKKVEDRVDPRNSDE